MERLMILFIVAATIYLAWTWWRGSQTTTQLGHCVAPLFECVKSIPEQGQQSLELCASACNRFDLECMKGCMQERQAALLEPCKKDFFACAENVQPPVDMAEIERLWERHMGR